MKTSDKLHEASKQITGASYEYPGYIHVEINDTTSLHVGNANGPIGYDFGDCTEELMRESHGEEIPVTSSIGEIVKFTELVLAKYTDHVE
tara:strand:- start:1208 stop:1477 length:270 start_codon:yes stop_codon:yes gene_type:complete